jgi:hypothetical protein
VVPLGGHARRISVRNRSISPRLGTGVTKRSTGSVTFLTNTHATNAMGRVAPLAPPLIRPDADSPGDHLPTPEIAVVAADDQTVHHHKAGGRLRAERRDQAIR